MDIPPSVVSMNYFRALEFDLPKALLRDLVSLFEDMSSADLTQENVSTIEDGQGVYQLFYRNELVYVGKTDLEAGLRMRLLRHSSKIRSRLNLDSHSVKFKAVKIYVFTTMDLENALIKHYKNTARAPSWNLSGFGSNDPGRQRDSSKLKQGHFDSSYPIDLDFPVAFDFADSASAASLLKQLKENLPFLLRFQCAPGSRRTPHPDLQGTAVSLVETEYTVRSLLEAIALSLGIEWQITSFPGYLIVYKERTYYSNGEVIGRQTQRLPLSIGSDHDK